MDLKFKTEDGLEAFEAFLNRLHKDNERPRREGMEGKFMSLTPLLTHLP
jgi:hypothetical protein